MKILFVTRTAIDYGLDALYDGFCRVLRHENVLDYPTKSLLHSGDVKREKYRRYPCFFDHPITKTNDEKVQMLKNGVFDFIIVGCRVNGDFRREPDGNKYDDFFELLKEKSKIIPTFLIDQDDLLGINEKLREDLNCKLYFKREFKGYRNPYILPLNFSYSEKYVPKNINVKKDIPLFWLGTFQHYRRRFLEIARDIAGIEINRPKVSQKEYIKELMKSRIGLSIRGRGFDTVRYYEIPAHGIMLLSQRPKIEIKNNFVDGESAVFFSNPDELRDKLAYCLNHPDYVDKIRINGYKWFIKYHTSKTRAEQVIGRMRLWEI